MKKPALVATLLAFALVGCASQPKVTFVRADGQRLGSDPTYQQQLDSDLATCGGNAPKASFFEFGRSDRGNPCMEEKGYVQVTEDQAGAERAELAAIADQQRIAALPPLPAATLRQMPAKRRQLGQPKPKTSRATARQITTPATAKTKKPRLTNPLKLQD